VSRIFLVAAALLTGTMALAEPASAQDSGERVNQLIVYGKDPCPPSTGDQITVCARKDESERYRIPEALRGSRSPEDDAWNNRVLAYETVGKYGSLSCSPAGAGGWTGCLDQMIETAYAERQSDPSLRFSELIAEERARRLSTIDEEAAATQSRVEEAEREYEQRQQDEAEKAEEEPSAEN
jgi:hypothetical protein